MHFDRQFHSRRRVIHGIDASFVEHDRRTRTDAHQRAPRIRRSRARIDAISEHTHRRINTLRDAGNLRHRWIGHHLTVLPRQDLLIVPADPDADIVHRRCTIRFLGQQILAHGLRPVNDLRETVVVVSRFDEDAIVVAQRRRWSGNDGIIEQHRELHGGEELPGNSRIERRNSCRVTRHEGELRGGLRSERAAGRQIDMQVAAVDEEVSRDFEGRFTHKAKSHREPGLAQRVRVDLTPAHRIGRRDEQRIRLALRLDCTVIAVVTDSTFRPRTGEDEGIAVRIWKVLADRELLLRCISESRWCGRQPEAAWRWRHQRLEECARRRNHAAGLRQRCYEIGDAAARKGIESGADASFELQIGVRERRRCITDGGEVLNQWLERAAAPCAIEPGDDQNAEVQSRSVETLREREQAESGIDWHQAI